MKRRPRLNLLILAAAAALTVTSLADSAAHASVAGAGAAPVATPAPVSASPAVPAAPTEADVKALTIAQVPLIQLIDALRAVKDGPASGFSSAVMNVPANDVHVYWKGEMAAAATDLIAKARATGVGVEVSAAPYTLTQLRGEMDRITTDVLEKQATDVPHVVSAGMRNDGSGIDVGVSGPTLSGAAAANAAATAPGDATAGAQSPPLTAASYPHLAGAVQLSLSYQDESAHAQFDSRGEPDPAAHWGAGMLLMVGDDLGTDGSCTAGFGLNDGSSANNGHGDRFMLTAAHCLWDDFFTGGAVIHPDDSDSVGRTVGISNTYDTQLISAPTSQWVWDGTNIDHDVWDADHGQFVKAVTSSTSVYPGEFVCESGAWTGVGCGITVDTWPNSRGMAAGHTTGWAAAGYGDSGGPVFTSKDGWQSDSASGLIDGCGLVSGHPCGWMPCPAGFWSTYGKRAGSKGCSSELDIVDINAAINIMKSSSPTGNLYLNTTNY